MKTGTFHSWRVRAGLLLAVAALLAGPARAALFDDDEARRAILDLRSRVEQQRLATETALQRQAEDLRRSTDENGLLRRSLLDLFTG